MKKGNCKTLDELKENSTILSILLATPHLVYTKQELMNLTGMNERAVREELENIARYYPVRASAGSKGYSIIWFDDNSSIDDLKTVNELAYSQVCEIQHRIDSLKARMKPLIALMKVTAVKLQVKTQGDK